MPCIVLLLADDVDDNAINLAITLDARDVLVAVMSRAVGYRPFVFFLRANLRSNVRKPEKIRVKQRRKRKITVK